MFIKNEFPVNLFQKCILLLWLTAIYQVPCVCILVNWFKMQIRGIEKRFNLFKVRTEKAEK